MKPGDFVDVHFPDGCCIGRLVSDDGDTLTIEFKTIFGGNIIVKGIPKNVVTRYVAV